MENINFKMIIRIAIILLIIVIAILTTNIIYTKRDTKKFKEYIEKNYNTDIKKDNYYRVYKNKKILTKSIKIDNNLNSRVTMSIDKKNEIKGTLELYGTNIYGNEGVSYLESTYKNKKFDCKIISNDGYKARCDILKKYTEDFQKEFNSILKKSKTKFKYLKP